MNDTLFDLPEQPSPRLAWMRRNQVTAALVKDEDLDDMWAAKSSADHPNRQWGFGATEHEAVADLAQKRGWKLWNEETPL